MPVCVLCGHESPAEPEGVNHIRDAHPVAYRRVHAVALTSIVGTLTAWVATGIALVTLTPGPWRLTGGAVILAGVWRGNILAAAGLTAFWIGKITRWGLNPGDPR